MNFKYELGETVYVIHRNNIQKTKICHRIISDKHVGFKSNVIAVAQGISYETHDGHFCENKIFKTRTELIEDLSK